MGRPMPAVFLGHGNAMNALHSNEWTKGRAAVRMPKPKAIVYVSAL